MSGHLHAVSGTWDDGASGGCAKKWSAAANWVACVPNGVGDIANFLGCFVSCADADITITVGTINLDAGAAWCVAGGMGCLVFDSTCADDAQINVTTGNGSAIHVIGLGSAIMLNDDLTVCTSSGGFVNLAGCISCCGTKDLIKTGAGTLILSGDNCFAGTVCINVGVLEVQDNCALGNTGCPTCTTVSSGASLAISGGLSALGVNETIFISGTGVACGGVIHNVSGNNDFCATINLTADALITIDCGSCLEFLGNVIT